MADPRRVATWAAAVTALSDPATGTQVRSLAPEPFIVNTGDTLNQSP